MDKQPQGRQSDCAPIDKLSPEVLLRIFSFVQNIAWSPDPARTISWIKVTHVCRYWRSLAIDSRVLWDTPPTHLHKWTEVMLERSGTAPLTIKLSYFALRSRSMLLDEKQMKINTMVFGNLDRIRTLSIDMDFVSLTTLQDFLQESVAGNLNASLLEELTFASTPEDLNRDAFHLKSVTFKKAFCLRKIRLIETRVDWNSPLLNNLTDFSYRLTILPPAHLTWSPTWQEIADALVRMPDLQSLQLAILSLTTDVPQTTHIKPVNLSHLRHLNLHFEFPAQIRSFLSLVTVPGLEELTILCDNYDDNPESYANTLHAVFDTLPTAFWEQICSMRLSGNLYSKGKTLDYLDFFRKPPLAKELIPGCLRLMLPCSQSKVADGRIRDIVNSLHLSKLTDVALLRVDLSAEALAGSLGRLPRLSSITVTGKSGLSLIEALTQIPPKSVASGRIPFANLSTITIRETILQRDGPGQDAREIRDNLERSIVYRQEHGAVLEKFQVVECCSTLSRTFEYVTGVEVDIDWEGMVSHYGDESDEDELDEEEDEQGEDEQEEDEAEEDEQGDEQ